MESNLLAAAAAEDIYQVALDGWYGGSYCHHVAVEGQLSTHRLDVHLEASSQALDLAPARPPWTWLASSTVVSYWFSICKSGKRTFSGALPSSISISVVVFSSGMRYCWEEVVSGSFGVPSPLASGFDF
jgi:hypothetical protein